MRPKLDFNFIFAAWRKRDRADLIFGGIIFVFLCAVLFFVWEGFILYKESFQKRILLTPVISEPLISPKDLEDTLRMVGERKGKFSEILGPG